MILDKATEFSNQQSLAGAAAGVTYSTNALPLGAAVRDVGQGTPVYLHIHVDTPLVFGAADTTIQFSLIADIQESMPTVLAQVLWSGHAYNFAAMGAVTDVCVAIPPMDNLFATVLGNAYTHMRVGYVVTGTAMSSGVVSARLTLDPVSQRKDAADAVN